MSPVGRRTSRFAQYQREQKRRATRRRLINIGSVLGILALALFIHSSDASHSISLSQIAKPFERHTQVKSASTSLNEDQNLSKIIGDWADNYKFSATVEVREVNGAKRSASYHANDSIVTGSTFKVYVAYAILHAIEQGNYRMSTKLSDGNTVQADMYDMIVNSDNNAARALGFQLGWPAIDSLIASQGAINTNLNNYVGSNTTPVGDKHSTAADLALILQKLQAGELLSAANTQYLLQLMETQNYRSAIPAGVPSGVTVADKPGWLTPADGIYEYVWNDAAIVYGPKSTYILVITTNGNSSTAPLANLSKQIYNYLEQ